MITNNFSITVIRIILDKSIIRNNNSHKHKKFIRDILITICIIGRLKLFLPITTGLGALPF